MAGIVPESWLKWGIGAEGDLAPRPPEADMLAAHDAVTTNSREAQQKLSKLVNQGRHTLPTLLRRRNHLRQHAPPDRASRWVGPRSKPSPRLAI